MQAERKRTKGVCCGYAGEGATKESVAGTHWPPTATFRMMWKRWSNGCAPMPRRRRGALTGIFGSNAGLCGEYTTLGVRGIAPASQQKGRLRAEVRTIGFTGGNAGEPPRGVGAGSRWLSRVLVSVEPNLPERGVHGRLRFGAGPVPFQTLRQGTAVAPPVMAKRRHGRAQHTATL